MMIHLLRRKRSLKELTASCVQIIRQILLPLLYQQQGVRYDPKC